MNNINNKGTLHKVTRSRSATYVSACKFIPSPEVICALIRGGCHGG